MKRKPLSKESEIENEECKESEDLIKVEDGTEKIFHLNLRIKLVFCGNLRDHKKSQNRKSFFLRASDPIKGRGYQKR